MTRDLLADLHAVSGFRNLPVHDEARMDDGRVFPTPQDDLSTLDRFARAAGPYPGG